MRTYRAAVIGCSRMGGFIDHEVVGHPSIVLPYSHAAGYVACPRTELAACADLRPDVLAAFGEQYGIPPARRYTDYRALLQQEQPEIVSVATQPEQRAEIVLAAVEAGARAVYAEKAMAASTGEAAAMVEAVERRGVVFNLGTNRRWHPGFERMRRCIGEGEFGELRTLVAYVTGSLFNTASHTFDLLFYLNGDVPARWVQANLPRGESALDGDLLREDPVGEGLIEYENGVRAYALNTGRGTEFEAICDGGVLISGNNGDDWQIRRRVPLGIGRHTTLRAEPFPRFEHASTTLRLIEDLVQALDAGGPTRGGVRIARANTELIFAFVESHRRGGSRVNLPLGPCPLRLERAAAPRQPRLAAT